MKLLFTVSLFLSTSQLVEATQQASPNKTSPSVVNKRIGALVALYNHSTQLYEKEGPSSFWTSFAFLANKEEIQFLMQATKGYPELPHIKQSSFNSFDISYSGSPLSKIVVKDFDQQIFIVSDKTIQISHGASIEKISSLMETQFSLGSLQKPFWRNFLEDFFYINKVHALGKRSKNNSSQRKGLFSRLFGAGAHSFNGIPSNTGTQGSVGVSNNNAIHANSGAATASEAALSGDTTRAPIPAPETSMSGEAPRSAPQDFTTTRETNKYYTGANNPSGSLKVETLSGPLGTQCTIVFTRHGQKQYLGNGKGTQNLTSKTGVQQAEALAFSMQDFANAHGPFDYAFHSAETRSIQTAAPVLKTLGMLAENAKGGPLSLNDFNECTSKDGISCKERALRVFDKLKQNYCKDGKKIFISGHGGLGLELLKASGVRPSTYPDCARPFVIAINSTGGNQLIHQPQTSADEGAKSMCNKTSAPSDG